MSVNTFLRSQPLVLAALLLGGALIIGVGIASYTAYTIKAASEVVEVTGSAKVAVRADFARWMLNLDTRTGINNQQEGYDRLAAATERILAYLAEEGFTEVETPVAMTNPTYFYPQNGEPVQTGFSVSRLIIVSSDQIEKLTEIANNLSPLVGTNYNVASNGMELTYQQLPETRVTLLTEAIADAKARAEAIAKETGRSVGTLRSATGGVVQVLPEGGVEVSDYGMYDTQNINKEVMVTVRATFSLR